MAGFEKPTDKQLEARFVHQAPSEKQKLKYAQVRSQLLATAKVIRDLTPVCPEQSRAFNALDDAMFLANAAIARHDEGRQEAGVTAAEKPALKLSDN